MPKKRTTDSSPPAGGAIRARRPSARKSAPQESSPAGGPGVRINIPGQSLPLAIPNERAFQQQAIRWSYALRNRERWNTQRDAVGEQEKSIRKLAAELGLRPEYLDQIAEAGIVEVKIPWTEEKENWALRIFPWEFMLATAARERSRDKRLTVVRHLDVGRAARPGVPSTWLQVLSAPGLLGSVYNFEGERRLLELSVQAAQGTFNVIKDPDEPALRSEIQSLAPHVVHLSGFDSHEALAVLEPDRETEVRDGYYLRSGPLEAEELAASLTSAPAGSPLLVATNFYHSGARIAPLCVARGARAAIGFQDSFDDELAELFFATFYQAWSLANWNLTAGFQFAWQSVVDQHRPLQGSAIVLWSDCSLLDEAPAAGERADKPQKKIRDAWIERSQEKPTAATIRSLLEVYVEPISQLNYSILHNNGPLFERFRVRKTKAEVGRIDGLLVNVELHVGTDSYPFRLQVDLEETAPYVDLVDSIRVSLASSLTRAIRESIHTSLFVEVTWQGVTLYRRTSRVTLLPVDEWRFDTKNYRWLPSFVLPRDPAVLRVVDAAQRYLMALRDDATAGFDGYQGASGAKPRPDDCAMVDMQVRALWSALLYETPLSYINPPPSFTESSQRLRTPSDCIDGKRGTCIDLALLLASCLEYVEIYPTVFLLRTHAFPAYWRHDSFHHDFRLAHNAEPQSDVKGQRVAWDFQSPQYREILGEVQAGRLVPLETTLITGRGSFAKAVSWGVQNLGNRREFESMIDILLARTDEATRVTPLPMRRMES